MGSAFPCEAGEDDDQPSPSQAEHDSPTKLASNGPGDSHLWEVELMCLCGVRHFLGAIKLVQWRSNDFIKK